MIATKEVKRRDNPYTTSLSINQLISITVLTKRLADDLKVNVVTFTTLLALYEIYITTGFGSSCMELCNLLNSAFSPNYVAMHDRLILMRSKGYVEIVGTTKGNARLFAPTPYLVDYIGSNYRLVECKESADSDQ